MAEVRRAAGHMGVTLIRRFGSALDLNVHFHMTGRGQPAAARQQPGRPGRGRPPPLTLTRGQVDDRRFAACFGVAVQAPSTGCTNSRGTLIVRQSNPDSPAPPHVAALPGGYRTKQRTPCAGALGAARACCARRSGRWGGVVPALTPSPTRFGGKACSSWRTRARSTRDRPRSARGSSGCTILSVSRPGSTGAESSANVSHCTGAQTQPVRGMIARNHPLPRRTP